MGCGPTSNTLNQQWVFVNKDSKSKSLSRSSGAEKTKIYGHVRQHMVRDNLVVQEEFNHVFRDNPTKIPKRQRPRRQKQQTLSDGDRVVDEDSESHKTGDVGQSMAVATGKGLGALSFPRVSISLQAAPYSRSYEYFRQRTISDATSFADRQFWDASMQLSATNEAIFHALTSLGALHESLMNETSRSEFHQASLSHCNRAIRAVVGAEHAMPLPMVLVTCIIFTTIQIFGDAPMAQRTLESGIRLVSMAQKQLARFSSSEQALLDLVSRMIERYQSRLTLVLLPTTVVKEHFGRAEIMSHMPKVPPNFESLLQAREILQAICDWSFHIAKSSRTLLLTDELQDRWVQAIVKLSESSELHPLSMRSVNLLKIARLASACLITAQFMTGKLEIDEYFPTFHRLLEQYADSFKLCKSNAIFTTVFHIDAGIVDILRHTAETSSDIVMQVQAQQALKMGATLRDRLREAAVGTHVDEDNDDDDDNGHTLVGEGTDNLRIQSLDFFAQSGLGRLRLKRNVSRKMAASPTEVRWFSILETPGASDALQQGDVEADVRPQWTQAMAFREE